MDISIIIKCKYISVFMTHNYILYEMNFLEREYDFIIVGAGSDG